jgi:tetratricopeptide (TPR) repeat protein
MSDMAMDRYPENTIATIQDFRASGWKVAVMAAERPGYSEIWQSLSKAAREAIGKDESPKAKVLWLLADSCSMMLKPKSLNEPFTPFAVFDGKRSPLPEDFSEDDLSFLAEVTHELDNEWVRSRVADVVWLCKKPRIIPHAIAAIDAYRAIQLDAETWAHGARDCWERAIVLARHLKNNAGTRLQEIESTLLAKFNAEPPGTGFFRVSLARLLLDNKLARDHAQHIADDLANYGTTLLNKGAHYEARSYLEAAGFWYDRSSDKNRQADMTCAVAETWVNEAVARTSVALPSHMVAASCYENAIQTYRRVPRALRSNRNVDLRLAELHVNLTASGTASLGEMGVVSSGTMDMTDLIQSAQASVRGKTTLDALEALANVHLGARKKNIKSFSEKMLRENPLQAFFSVTNLSSDGRVIAKRPGIGFCGPDSDDYKMGLRAEMVKQYSMEIGLVVCGQIWPALQAFTLEHRIRESDLVQIVAQSPIVPEGRIPLIAKALFSGLEQDFVSATHILVPQVEHLVRWHLKAANVKTTTLSKDGVETENGLSTLVDLPEVEKIFGEDLAFEFKALFCDAFGPNLRNELAHGLLDDAACQSAPPVYAWWLLLRITFNTFWNAARQLNHDEPAVGYPPDVNEAAQWN